MHVGVDDEFAGRVDLLCGGVFSQNRFSLADSDNPLSDDRYGAVTDNPALIVNGDDPVGVPDKNVGHAARP
jgi:hypothetical protein